MALPPNFPTSPYVYVLYAYDAPIGGTAPTWNDACPTPPGPTTDGCLVSGRVSRLQISGNVMTGSEQVLINDWCQQFPSHSVGTLLFGRDGYLYVTGGDGASFNNVDYGQYGDNYAGDRANPCGDPPGAVGTPLSPPGAEGGALRSQSVRRTDGPATLDGAVLRIDPATGAGVPGNPFFSSSDANARRIVAYGLRNPFRITQRPGTDELWIGDVGWNTWEEINRVIAPASPTASNFGWPCYEGASPQGGYQGAGLSLCSSLYSTPGSVIAPYYTYNHSACVVNYTGCHTGGSSITGVAFYQGGSYPAHYNGALFFADHSRNEIWAMLPGTNGLPDPSRLQIVRRRRCGRRCRRASRRPEDRPRRRPVLRRHGGRHRPPHHLHGRQPAADRGDHGEPDQRHRPADGQLRRHRLVRPGRQAAELFVGSQRRRDVRRRDRPDRLVHLHDGGRLSPEPAGHRRPGRERHNVGHRHGRQHRADRGHRLARRA